MLHTCGDPRRRPAYAKARQGAADIYRHVPQWYYQHMFHFYFYATSNIPITGVSEMVDPPNYEALNTKMI